MILKQQTYEAMDRFPCTRLTYKERSSTKINNYMLRHNLIIKNTIMIMVMHNIINGRYII